jgi:hypothetical protein
MIHEECCELDPDREVGLGFHAENGQKGEKLAQKCQKFLTF